LRRNRAAPESVSTPHQIQEQVKQMADRETIIDTGGGGDGGMGAGMIAAIVIVVLLLIAGGYLVINHSGGGTSATLNVPNVTVTTPAKK
jgi:hypothetical protein